MEEIDRDFANDLIRYFGEDRFYHALLRWGRPREAKLFHVAMGGKESEWESKCDQLRLRMVGEDILSFPVKPAMDKGEAWAILCRIGFTISKHYKEFAARSPTLPPPIHARMVLGNQNEWTKKYAEWLQNN